MNKQINTIIELLKLDEENQLMIKTICQEIYLKDKTFESFIDSILEYERDNDAVLTLQGFLAVVNKSKYADYLKNAILIYKGKLYVYKKQNPEEDDYIKGEELICSGCGYKFKRIRNEGYKFICDKCFNKYLVKEENE